MTSRLQQNAGLIICFILCVFTLGAGAETRIIGGDETDNYPWVGLVGNTYAGGNSAGTLVSTRTVLTSAHTLFRPGPSPTSPDIALLPREVWVEFDGQRFRVLEIILHPDYNPATLANDLAILVLRVHVTGIQPVDLRTVAPTVGTGVEFVGFGADGSFENGHDGSFGTKRVGQNSVSDVNDEYLMWEFDSVNEENTAPGDSGAPVFINGDLAAVHSASTTSHSGEGDISLNTRVDTRVDWINDPYTGNRIVVYSFREQSVEFGGGDRQFIRREGYVAVNSIDNEVWAAVATRHIPDTTFMAGTENWGSDQVVASTIQHRRRPVAVLSTQQSEVVGVSIGAAPNRFTWRHAEGNTSGGLFAASAPVARVLRGETFLADPGSGTVGDGRLRLRFIPHLSERTANLTTEEVAERLLERLMDEMGDRAELIEAPADANVEAAVVPDSTNSTRIRIHRVSGLMSFLSDGQLERNRVTGYLVFQGSTQQATLLLVALERGRQAAFAFGLNLHDANTFLNFLAQAGPRSYIHTLGLVEHDEILRLLLTGNTINHRNARRFNGDLQFADEEGIFNIRLRTAENRRLMRDFAVVTEFDTVVGLMIDRLEDDFGFPSEDE